MLCKTSIIYKVTSMNDIINKHTIIIARVFSSLKGGGLTVFCEIVCTGRSLFGFWQKWRFDYGDDVTNRPTG